MKFTQEEIDYLNEARCYNSLNSLVWNDADYNDLECYIGDEDNFSMPLNEWYIGSADWYFEYNGLHFINRANEEFNLDFKELLEKLYEYSHFETRLEFYKAVKQISKE